MADGAPVRLTPDDPVPRRIAPKHRELYVKFARLWPERRKLDTSDKTEV